MRLHLLHGETEEPIDVDPAAPSNYEEEHVPAPVDHRDPALLASFQLHEGTTMTANDVMALAPPIPVLQPSIVTTSLDFDGCYYNEVEFYNWYGSAERFAFSQRVMNDIMIALPQFNEITNFCRVYASENEGVQRARDGIFRVLFDPKKPRVWTSVTNALTCLFLRPLWLRREHLEKLHGMNATLEMKMTPQQVADTKNAWLAAWLRSPECNEVRRPREGSSAFRNRCRSAWIAAIKRDCGGRIWAALLIQYGAHRVVDIIPHLLAAQSERMSKNDPLLQDVQRRMM
eukprot:Skav222047  [mRNA]  locus=scaffold1020:392225:393085:+ [translate_table: standard]